MRSAAWWVLSAVCWVLSAGCGVLSAQQAPVFQASTQLVEVDARVVDGNGRFVNDLTIDDFEVLERGVAQPLRGLYFVGTGAGDAPSAAPLVSWRGPTTSLAAAGSTAVARQTWIFVFDLNHLSRGGGFDRARQAVRSHLQHTFREGDLGGIVAGSRMVGNRLTSVRAELEAAAASVTPSSEHASRWQELTRQSPRLRDVDEMMAIAGNDRDAIQRAVVRVCTEDPTLCQNADAMVRDKALRMRTEWQRASLDTLNALTALANGLARIPGPKTIVLLSDGFMLSGLEGALRATVGQISRAAARVYAIDVRGLNLGAAADIGDRAAAEDAAGAPARFDSVSDAPNSLAVDTGGFVVRHDNNVGRALDQIAADANQYYVLVFEPRGLTLDGQFRPIEVRVTRPGMTVRARRGYLALPSAQLLLPQPKREHP